MRHFGKSELFFFLIKIMPRYFNRRYKRRNYRRKALTTARIFGKTSAKSQAKQIYALKKSVNSLNRRFKPEIMTHHLPNVYTKTFTNSTFADSYWSGYYAWPASGTGDEDKRGDKIWCKNMQLNFTFEYHNNSNTAYHGGESSGCPVRIIIIKSKTPVGVPEPSLNNILLYSSHSGSEYTQRAVSPYVHGITDKFKLLYNKVFYLNPTYNQKALRIFLKPGLIQWETNSMASHIFMYVAPCGLHSDSDFTETIEMTMSGKIAFLDY